MSAFSFPSSLASFLCLRCAAVLSSFLCLSLPALAVKAHSAPTLKQLRAEDKKTPRDLSRYSLQELSDVFNCAVIAASMAPSTGANVIRVETPDEVGHVMHFGIAPALPRKSEKIPDSAPCAVSIETSERPNLCRLAVTIATQMISQLELPAEWQGFPSIQVAMQATLHTLTAMYGTQVARNVQMEMHKHHNIGLSFIAGFGSYADGDLIFTTPCGTLEDVDISTHRRCPGVFFDGRWECCLTLCTCLMLDVHRKLHGPRQWVGGPRVTLIAYVHSRANKCTPEMKAALRARGFVWW